MNFGILHVSQPQLVLAEARRALVPGGRFAFTTWVAEGNAQDEITAAAVSEHGVAVEVPEEPSYYVFSELEECRAALAAAGFVPDSVSVETITAEWHLSEPDALLDAQLHAGVRTRRPSCAHSRPTGSKRSERRWRPVYAATPMATASRCRSSPA
jgi:SAM-dependent methyltransferase